jgi:hypothetical protein
MPRTDGTTIAISRDVATRLRELGEQIPRSRGRGGTGSRYNKVLEKILEIYDHGVSIEQARRIMNKLNIIRHERELTWEDVTWLVDDLLQESIQENIE